MLLPGEVAKLHLQAKDLKEIKPVLLGRLRVYLRLDDVDQYHHQRRVPHDEVESCAVVPRE